MATGPKSSPPTGVLNATTTAVTPKSMNQALMSVMLSRGVVLLVDFLGCGEVFVGDVAVSDAGVAEGHAHGLVTRFNASVA